MSNSLVIQKCMYDNVLKVVIYQSAAGCRMQFVPQIVNGLMKLGLHNQASPENRKLSLDLAGLIVYWEQRRLSESRNKDQVTITLRGLIMS